MSKKLNDTAFLTLSAMLKAREANMLGRERMDRMLAAQTYGEAAKLLMDCGYPDLSEADAKGIDAALSARRGAIFSEISAACPSGALADVFRLKYDYHNIKVLIKSEGAGVAGGYLLSDSGRVAPAALEEAYTEEAWTSLPDDMARVMPEAKSVLNRTGNPQLADFALDAACFEKMLSLAKETGSAFVEGYVKALIDSANLRTAVRTVRMGKDADFLRTALSKGGAVEADRMSSAAFGGEGLASLFTAGPFREAAALAAEAVKGGSVTAFELACDNAVSAYLSEARLRPFGIEPVAEYLALTEAEITAVRMILTGKLSGIAPDVIRERLRDINA